MGVFVPSGSSVRHWNHILGANRVKSCNSVVKGNRGISWPFVALSSRQTFEVSQMPVGVSNVLPADEKKLSPWEALLGVENRGRGSDTEYPGHLPWVTVFI